MEAVENINMLSLLAIEQLFLGRPAHSSLYKEIYNTE
jgi:hypothetical protein